MDLSVNPPRKRPFPSPSISRCMSRRRVKNSRNNCYLWDDMAVDVLGFQHSHRELILLSFIKSFAHKNVLIKQCQWAGWGFRRSSSATRQLYQRAAADGDGGWVVVVSTDAYCTANNLCFFLFLKLEAIIYKRLEFLAFLCLFVIQILKVHFM